MMKEQSAQQGRGQSLVETAIVAPILILMLLGVFEVGWALRGYLIVANATREAARFAARGRYIDFNLPQDEVEAGYRTVITHTLDALGYNFANPQALEEGDATVGMMLSPPGEANSAIIISHFLIDTQQPCNPADDCNGNGITATIEGPEIDCAVFKNDPPAVGYTADDNIQGPHTHPLTQTYVFPSPSSFVSRIRTEAVTLTNEYRAENNYFNCALHSKDPNVEWSTDSVIAVEIFFDQPQLLGVPIISNRFTDPISLYAFTQMRITGDARSTGR
jgi:hypothetical protein